ncbi:nitrate/nitrite two-component system sensor histidine kinase NarX [Martelella alba]|uniref:Sensor protein n=1 Tax=Martelella alba TaxID=2590451 RepID=A0ABY2SM00_9HYPH|nr:nitrate/nitrite two-component system sensor histidine kinase NarX [Martelella alba]TKI06570.1 nitrate/nitrite two-component system sensor histidine kinase NarX [Martelella alba]
MLKPVRAPFSIVRQVTVLMVALSLLGIGGMALSLWLAESMQGNAHAINKAGSLRMQSYRLLSRLPLGPDSRPLLNELERDQLSADLRQPVRREQLAGQYLAVRSYWLERLRPRLLNARRPSDAADDVAEFVRRLDTLVSAIEHQTERRLMLVALVQKVAIALSMAVLLVTIIFLRRRLLEPWRRLLRQADAVAGGDFSQRYPLPAGQGRQGRHEMDLLGQTLNSMSASLSQMYAELEQRVTEKTADLQRKNQVLDYLYRASRQLHDNQPVIRRLMPVLEELPAFTPLREIRIKLYENNDDELVDEPEPPAYAAAMSPITPAGAAERGFEPLSWRLQDKLGDYGLVLARRPAGQSLDEQQQRLMDTLMEQFTSTLALERQSEQRQHMLVMAERTAIAAELHDSIAQSLSCLKLQISCLQMQSRDTTTDNKILMQQMREELNTAYRQLRELLTTFRLGMAEPGLRAALKNMADEFSNKLGFRIGLDYQLPAGTFTPHQVIHLAHIAREALTNIVKHAQADRVAISAYHRENDVVLSIRDNGCGLPDEQARPHHYGLMIMQDRAASLPGRCQFRHPPDGGTDIMIIVETMQTALHSWTGMSK